MVQRGEDLLKGGAIQRVCGICSGDLHIETGVTRFKTIEEGRPELLRLQEANLMTMRILQGRKN